MPSQASSSNIPSFIDLGNCIVYIGVAQASFAAAKAYTGWRKLGLLKDGAEFRKGSSVLELKSGMPLKTVKKFITEETLSVSGTLAEFSATNLNRVLGSPGMTIALKGTGVTTIKTGTSPSQTSFELTSATGYAVDQEIEVTTGTLKQYGVIKTLAGAVVTLYEALDGNTTPIALDAVKIVDTRDIVIGTLAAPATVGIKISKTFVSRTGGVDILIPSAQAAAELTMNWADNSSPDAVGIPFQWDAISDSAVESGALADIFETH